MKHVRLGIVGLGNIGKFHTGYLLDKKIARCELTAVSDAFAPGLEPFKGRPNLKTFATVEEMMDSGAIDAIEFVGPLNDLSFGLHKVAKFYYWPGWLEPSGPYDIMINPKAWATLSVTEQEIVKAGAAVAMKANIDEMWAKNATAYNQLTGELKVQVRQIPDDTIRLIADQAYKVCEAEAGKDADSKEVWASVMKFRKDILPYMKVSEYDFMRIRELVKFG